MEAERSMVEEEVVKEEDKEVLKALTVVTLKASMEVLKAFMVVALKASMEVLKALMVVALKASVEVLKAPRMKVEGMEVAKGKNETKRKTLNVVVVEKEVVNKIVM